MRKLFLFLGLSTFVAIGVHSILSNNAQNKYVLDNIEALASEDQNPTKKYGFVFCDGHNIICTGDGELKCCV